MKFEVFQVLFSAALERRQHYLSDPSLAPWFKNTALPPIIGFGLPADEAPVHLVTIGLNPSDREVTEGFVPKSDDAKSHWDRQTGYFTRPYRTWFDKAERIVRAASGGEVSYGGVYGTGRRCVHLDVSPLPTAGKFDTVFDASERTPEERARAIDLLKRESDELLRPLVRLLVEKHQLPRVLIMGYCPPAGGSATMKRFWGRGAEFKVRDFGAEAGTRWAVGAWAIGTSLQLPVAFLSKGPSSQAGIGDLERAASRLSPEH
ncbi:MAG TPA: hypothetical protein VFZ09_37655 [Archangium sp.]|uniref:hypothetical protein n=1 Tax=Archangium sp. TaxID=1872627 RepID=UPI002E2FC075|nr:hypothetical protein [Archangium sp.]HEX5752006.1 hypothetical protein [Archangium sp.]